MTAEDSCAAMDSNIWRGLMSIGRMGRLRLTGMVVASCVGLGLLGAGSAFAETQTFTYTGGEQTFTVPAGVSSVEVLGVAGHGGSGSVAPNGPGGVTGQPGSPGKSGGSAAEVTGKLTVTPGETLYIEVGGNGQVGVNHQRSSGGFNGGGEGGVLASIRQ